ncbi:MAG: tRNA dihydrouridine synthase DusB [Gemmatimonadota bacterium]
MSANVFELLRGGGTPLYLAPQAGVSESPFRRLCRRFGADVVVTEFVSAAGIVMDSPRSKDYLRFDAEEHPIGVQIFGADPVMMADAAALVADVYGPDFIDINFGCPVKKVVKRNGGSGCLRDLDLVDRIVRAVDDATSLPTTVKIRSGFDEPSRDPVGIALRCQDAGARALCLHPRTRTDMYSGQARWSEIRDVVEALEIPVIGNGDIVAGVDARRMRDETGCAGIMIARGSHGDPWIFTQARAALDGRPVPPDPDVTERFEICLEHARNAIEFERNPERAIIDFRKHLGWYTKGLPDGRKLRTELFHSESLEQVEEMLRAYLAQHREVALV